MTPPVVKETAQSPPGVMPRRAQWLVFLLIAAAVMLASLFSGEKARKAAAPSVPPGPLPSQVTALQKRLEMDLQAAEEARKRNARLQELQSATSGVSGPPAAAVNAPDPVEAERKARSVRAPYAPSVVLRFEDDPRAPAESKSQIVFVAEERKDVPKEVAEKQIEPRLKESGQLLPVRDGDRYRLQQGTLIPTTLVNRLEGSFTGPVKCVVSKAILSEDEAALLIPKGSEVYGQAKKVEEANQTRLAITFDRLALKNGYSINLEGSPGLDSKGAAGVPGKVNNHNVRKLTVGGVLGTIASIGTYAGQGGPFAAAVANSTGSSATSILNRSLSTLPSITIPEGSAIYVFLQKDFVIREYQPRTSAEERTSK